MESIRKDEISFFGEFVDKDLEREFFDYDMRRYAKVVGPVALVFGAIYMMFLMGDYLAIENPSSFLMILLIRSLFLSTSVILYLAVKKIRNYTKLACLITAYEFLAILGFFIIIYYYESLSLLLFFSVMAMTLAIYITPNKVMYTQIISVFLSLSFFTFYAKRIEGIDSTGFLKIAAYHLIILCYCNIGAYVTNYYKRKQFADARELLRVSTTDPLTGIYNRAKFNGELNQWVEYCNANESDLSLVIFDIDDFKRVNDSYGHLVGDSIIQNITSAIKKAIRNTDVFARWGGDEFVILLPGTDTHQALEMMDRMRVCVQNSQYHKEANVTCSFGLAALRKNESAEALLQRADQLLYDAKGCGKNMVICESDTTLLEKASTL